MRGLVQRFCPDTMLWWHGYTCPAPGVTPETSHTALQLLCTPTLGCCKAGSLERLTRALKCPHFLVAKAKRKTNSHALFPTLAHPPVNQFRRMKNKTNASQFQGASVRIPINWLDCAVPLCFQVLEQKDIAVLGIFISLFLQPSQLRPRYTSLSYQVL